MSPRIFDLHPSLQSLKKIIDSKQLKGVKCEIIKLGEKVALKITDELAGNMTVTAEMTSSFEIQVSLPLTGAIPRDHQDFFEFLDYLVQITGFSRLGLIQVVDSNNSLFAVYTMLTWRPTETQLANLLEIALGKLRNFYQQYADDIAAKVLCF